MIYIPRPTLWSITAIVASLAIPAVLLFGQAGFATPQFLYLISLCFVLSVLILHRWDLNGTVASGLVLLLITTFISTAYSRDMGLSIFGRPGQNNGFYQLIVYATLYLVAWFNGDSLKRFVPMAIAVASVQVLTAPGFATDIQGRFVGTLGNSVFYGQWLAMLIPIVAYWTYQNRHKKAHYFGVGLTGLMLWQVMASGSRMAVYSLILALLVYLWHKKVLSAKWLVFTGIALVVAVVTIVSVIGRDTGYGNLIRVYSPTRMQVWSSWFEVYQDLSVKEYLIGTGPDTQPLFRDSHGLWLRDGRYISPFHNLIMDTLLTTGIAGLGAWAIIIYGIYRQWRKSSGIQYVLGLSLGIHLLYLMVQFQTVQTEPLFFLLLGSFDSKQPLIKADRNWWIVCFVVAMSFLFYSTWSVQ